MEFTLEEVDVIIDGLNHKLDTAIDDDNEEGVKLIEVLLEELKEYKDEQ